MSLRRSKRSNHVGLAGGSAAARFHEERIKNLKSEWQGWLVILGFLPASAALMLFFGKAGLAAGGFILGCGATLCAVGWALGFDARSLPWLWEIGRAHV